MAISLRAVGTPTAAADAVTGVSPGVPAGLTDTDISILTVEIKGASTTAPTITTPSGWTLIGTVTNNGTSAGAADTGSNTIGMYYRIGTYTAPTITTTNASSMGAAIVAYATNLGGWDVSSSTTGSDTTSGTNASITGAANITLATGDWVIAGVGLSGDIGSVTAETLAATGATIGTRANRINRDVTTGNDSRLLVTDWPVTAGTSSAAPVYTYTNASATTAHARFVRLREVNTFNTATYQANGVTVLGSTDAAVTAPSSLTDGAGVLKVDPYAGAEYDPNKTWSQAASGSTARPTFADALANDVYTEWTVSRTGGLLPKQIRVKVARGALGTSVRGFRVRWSVDGYASDLLGRDTALTSAETRPNLVQHPVPGDALQGDLSGTAQQTSVTFRIYNYATAAINTLEFDDLEFTFDVGVATTPTGSATGSWSFAGTGTGARTPKATGSGSWTFAGSASGKRTPKATGTGSFAFTGAAAGKRTAKGAATGSWAFTGSAAGKSVRKGTATGTAAFTGTAAGKRTPKGSAAGSWTFAGTAAGATTRSGTATGSAAWTGTATGSAPAVGVNDGAGTGTVTWTGTAIGRRTPKATATGATVWVGTATGTAPVVGGASGAATSTWTITGTAAGRTTKLGSSTGLLIWVGTATGTSSAPVGLEPLTRPVLAAFTTDGTTLAAFTGTATGTATYTTDGATAAAFTDDGVGAGSFA